MAPLVLELAKRPGLEAQCCVTAQHREMLDSVLNIFGVKPDYDLNIMQPQQTLSSITSRTLLGMEEVLEKAGPDLVLVHGDTSTTFAGALAAFYRQIPVGHVEAGLRLVDDRAQRYRQHLQGKVAEEPPEDHLPDDDGGQADDDGALAHAGVREALVLAEQRPGQGHQPVGEH